MGAHHVHPEGGGHVGVLDEELMTTQLYFTSSAQGNVLRRTICVGRIKVNVVETKFMNYRRVWGLTTSIPRAAASTHSHVTSHS